LLPVFQHRGNGRGSQQTSGYFKSSAYSVSVGGSLWQCEMKQNNSNNNKTAGSLVSRVARRQRILSLVLLSESIKISLNSAFA
jgi:hypothetical protein